MPELSARQHVEKAAEAHTNLTLFSAITTLMESGFLVPSYNASADRIIEIARTEINRQIRAYDKHTAAALRLQGADHAD